MAFTETRLGDLVDRVKCWNPASQGGDGELTYIDISSVDRESKAIRNPIRIPCPEAPSRARQLVASRDILVSTVRPNLNGVAVVPAEFDGATASTGYCVLRSNAERLCWRYLFHWVRSPAFVRDMTRKATGASYPAVSDRIIHESTIPLPPLAEQKRIAAILDKADAIRRQRKEAIAVSDKAVLAFYAAATTGRESSVRSIQSLLDDRTILIHKDGNHGSNYPRAEEFGGKGIPFLSAKYVAEHGELITLDVPLLSEKKARSLSFGWLERNDVLLAHNASVGRVGIYRGEYEEALIGTSLTCFRCDPTKLDPMYLFATLRSRHFQHQLTGLMSQSTRNQVPISAQRRLVLHVAPIDTQRAIGARLAKLIGLRSHQAWGFDASNDLFNSLVHRAFRGEL